MPHLPWVCQVYFRPTMGGPGIAPFGAPRNLLAPGNTDFADSATKTFGWKGASLKRLIAAITQYQNSPSEGFLREVNECLLIWMDENPKESRSTNRGSNALTLSQQILEIARTRQWYLWHWFCRCIVLDIGSVGVVSVERCRARRSVRSTRPVPSVVGSLHCVLN